MFHAAKEAQSLYNWLEPLLAVLGAKVLPIPILNDNDGASALALDPVGRAKNKHVRGEHHYTQELVASGIILPLRCDTSENRSDLLTKALGPTAFPTFAKTLVGEIQTPSSASVLMFSAIPTIRVSDAATQANLQTQITTREIGCQCNADSFESFLSPNDGLIAALRVVGQFSQEMCTVAEALNVQQQNMLQAATALNERMNALVIPPRSPEGTSLWNSSSSSTSSSSSSVYFPSPAASLGAQHAVQQYEQDLALARSAPASMQRVLEEKDTRSIPSSNLTFSPPVSEGLRRVLAGHSPIRFRLSMLAPTVTLSSRSNPIARSPRESIANSRNRHISSPATFLEQESYCSYCQRHGHSLACCRSIRKRNDKSLKRMKR